MSATTLEVTVEIAQQLGLLPEEFDRIKELMGRTPNFTELSLFSVMWSEHCCYKNSLRWLKTLPKDGPQILAAAGEENAGLVDIGEGLACCFKIESHNHPSAIEPYQGAATGVGGIHRDIFTMGARPIAALNSLRFGDINLERTKWLVRGVVKGIGDYGNSFGVPTIGGEAYFDKSYNVNPLVNAMSIGIVENGKTVSATAKGPGNPVYIVGSATGKDGIHGATFASADIDEDSEEKLPSVQVGDPFQEKLLLEATLEAIAAGVVVGMQDMGAAGIACSTSEMSEKGDVGMKVYLDRVPTRQENMKPFEILLSESQERMLVVAEKGKEEEMLRIFDKWDLNCEQIGEVTAERNLQYFMRGELVAEVDPLHLVLGGEAPVYEREYREPKYFEDIRKFNIDDVKEPQDLKEVAKFLAGHPNIASKRWISEQYDSMVQTNTQTTNAPSDAPTIRLKGTKRSIAASVDCNSYYVHADPEIGGAIAVSEAARNLVCTGARPLAITNCLNFGNPYNPESYYQFVGAIKGMTAACTRLGTPVTGGNVSFYNNSAEGGPVLPTPTIGMIGLIADSDKRMTLNFKNEGDLIYLVGKSRNNISSSQYLIHYHNIKFSPAPYFHQEEEYNLHMALLAVIEEGLIASAHDCAEGGLFIALLESALTGNKGFTVAGATDENLRKDAYLFGEAQGRVVISVSPDQKDALEKKFTELNTPFTQLGEVKGTDCIIGGENFGSVAEFRKVYEGALPGLLG